MKAIVSGLALVILFTGIALAVVIPYGIDHNWDLSDWSSFAAILAAAFTALASLGTFFVVFLTARYVDATNKILKATADAAQATRSAVEVSERALETNRKMVIANRAMVDEMKESRIAGLRPVVLIAFRVNSKSHIVLTIGNYGNGPATDVRFQFDPPLENGSGQEISSIESRLARGLPVLPPSEPAETIFFDFHSNYFDVAYLLGQRSVQYSVVVEYVEPLNAGHQEQKDFTISLAHLGPPPLLQDQFASFQNEWERARNWNRVGTITDQDEKRFTAAIDFAERYLPSEIDFSVPGNVHRAIEELGWTVDQKQPLGGCFASATKNHGPYLGRRIGAAGPSLRKALIQLLEEALKFDIDHPSPRLRDD